jgi:hypothetical protein
MVADMAEVKEACKSTLYPHTYPMRGWVKVVSVVLGVVLFICASLLPWLPPRAHGFGPTLAIAILCILGFALGIGLILGSCKNKLILYEDAIEQVGIFGRRRLEKVNIAYKYTMVLNLTFLILVPRDSKQSRIKIELGDYIQDEAFNAWMKSIPNQ